MTDIAARKAQLLARRAEIETRLRRIEERLDAPHSADWAEDAVEREDDEVLEDLGQAGAAEIERIDAALARIEAGTYGICATCGEPIAPERLDVMPATPFCRHCAP